MCWVILHSVHSNSKEATSRRVSRSVEYTVSFFDYFQNNQNYFASVCVFIYDTKHMLWRVWELKIWKKLQEIYMNRISLFQLPHLIRARVEFCTYAKKKSIFLLDFSSKSLKEGSKTNILFDICVSLFL